MWLSNFLPPMARPRGIVVSGHARNLWRHPYLDTADFRSRLARKRRFYH